MQVRASSAALLSYLRGVSTGCVCVCVTCVCVCTCVCVHVEMCSLLVSCSVDSLEPFSQTVLDIFRRNARDSRCGSVLFLSVGTS